MNNNFIGINLSTNGVPRIEIDESKIVGNGNNIIWMFDIIDCSDKDTRIFYVMNDRTAANLLPIIEKNVYTINDDNDEDNNIIYSLKTRIYSDFFASYQQRDI